MVIFAILCFGVPPFTTWQEGGLISGMVRCLGPLPEEWKGCYIHSNELDHWYDQHTKPDPKVTIEARIKKLRPDLDATYQELICSIMSKVFVFRPEERLTATQFLHDPSFRADGKILWLLILMDIWFPYCIALLFLTDYTGFFVILSQWGILSIGFFHMIVNSPVQLTSSDSHEGDIVMNQSSAVLYLARFYVLCFHHPRYHHLPPEIKPIPNSYLNPTTLHRHNRSLKRSNCNKNITHDKHTSPHNSLINLPARRSHQRSGRRNSSSKHHANDNRIHKHQRLHVRGDSEVKHITIKSSRGMRRWVDHAKPFREDQSSDECGYERPP